VFCVNVIDDNDNNICMYVYDGVQFVLLFGIYLLQLKHLCCGFLDA